MKKSELGSAREFLANTDAITEGERLIIEASELLLRLMEEQAVRQVDLAVSIGRSAGHVSQLLSGRRNMTLRTFAELMHALGARAQLGSTSLDDGVLGVRMSGAKVIPIHRENRRYTVRLSNPGLELSSLFGGEETGLPPISVTFKPGPDWPSQVATHSDRTSVAV